jgi:hypothetical protein
MKIREVINEAVAGPKNCWPGHRKVGTQPGTGKNKGKRVNDCEEIKEQGVAEATDSDFVGFMNKTMGTRQDKAAVKYNPNTTMSMKNLTG